MRRVALILAFLLLAAVAGASDSTAYSLAVDVSPTTQPGFYMCRVTVTDLANGSVVFAPSIQLQTGSPARASSGDGDLVSEFQVSVDSESSRVTTEVTVTRAGRMVAAQKISVTVR